MSDSQPTTTDYVLGRILEKTASIDEKLARLLFRQDNLEVRLEALEKEHAAGAFQDKLVKMSILAILGGVGVVVLRVLGLV